MHSMCFGLPMVVFGPPMLELKEVVERVDGTKISLDWSANILWHISTTPHRAAMYVSSVW